MLRIALRNNDKAGVDDALRFYSAPSKRISTDKTRLSNASSNELSTPLHLAIQCAPTAMVEYIVLKGVVDLSAKNKNGNTALHLAAIQGREDVVELLLEQPDIDDSIANHDGKQLIKRLSISS